MTSLETTLLKIAEIFNRNDIPYILIGGYSMALHGCPRLTQDLDITLGLDTDSLDKLLHICGSDFKTLVTDPREFAEKTNVLLLEDKETGIRIDLIFSFIEFERQAVSNADTIEIDGVLIKNASIENLIIYKILAGRERDKEDVKILLNTHENININAVSSQIEELSLIMGNDAYKVWKKILLKL